jgi:hypothetical protein
MKTWVTNVTKNVIYATGPAIEKGIPRNRPEVILARIATADRMKNGVDERSTSLFRLR